MQQKIKEALARGIEHSEISLKDLMVLLTIFGAARSDEELAFLVDLFKDDYQIFKDMEVSERAEKQVNLESSVREFISQLIKTNPLKALEISRAAMEKGMTTEGLAHKFPEFGRYLRGKNV